MLRLVALALLVLPGIATAQSIPGNTLSTLGNRESGMAQLEEAVTAARAALAELNRGREPLRWAAAQYNLGNALYTLGEREGGTARLEEAVTAYRAALQERTRERMPRAWAISQQGLDTTLALLAKRRQ